MRDREAWHAAVHGVMKSWTQFGDWTTTITLSHIENTHSHIADPLCMTLSWNIEASSLVKNVQRMDLSLPSSSFSPLASEDRGEMITALGSVLDHQGEAILSIGRSYMGTQLPNYPWTVYLQNTALAFLKHCYFGYLLFTVKHNSENFF